MKAPPSYEKVNQHIHKLLSSGYKVAICKDVFIDHVGSASFSSANFDHDLIILSNQVYSVFKHLDYAAAVEVLKDPITSREVADAVRKKWIWECRKTLEEQDIIPFEIKQCLKNYPKRSHPFPKEETTPPVTKI